MNRNLGGIGRIAALIAVSGVIAAAQGTQTASLSGVVVDRSGKPVVGARIELSSPHLQGRRDLVSDATGRIISRLLPPGQYHIQISKEGFYTATMDVHMGLEQVYSPKVVLAPVAAATVEVVAALPGVDKTEVKTALNYTSDQIDALPVTRGTAMDIAALSPGVTKNANGDKGNIEIRGASGQGNLILVDGQNVMDNVYSGQRVKIIFDAVEETQVMTGAVPAEYGYIEGGVINQITKSGGNTFSGSVRFDVQNPAWNALKPHGDPSALANNMTQSESFTVGGPIIKDMLWFFAALYENKPFTLNSFNGTDVSGYPINTWVSPEKDFRREFKLTFSPNSNHTITATYNNNSDGWLRDAGGAGEFAGLSNFLSTGEFWGLSYRGIISESLTLNARIGGKKQVLGAHTSDNPQDYTGGVVISTYNTGAWFGAPIWDWNDPKPDSRDNQTWNLKASYFWNGAGAHETDFGADSYVGTTQSSGYQSGARISVPGYGMDMNLGYLNVTDYWQPTHTIFMDGSGTPGVAPGVWDFSVFAYQYVPDKLTVSTLGLYFNDKWTVDSHLMFNIGLRWDQYKSKANSVGDISSSSAMSPRLGVKYDFWGDSKLVGGLSWSRMQGRMQESQFQSATYVFTPIAYTFYGNMHNADFVSLISDPGTGAGPGGQENVSAILAGIQGPGNPFLNTTPGQVGESNAPYGTKFDKHIKPPQVDEYQLTLAYNFTSDMFGSGFLRATAVQKKWSNIIDRIIGAPGQTQDNFGNVLDLNYWTNQPLAKRDYKSLELDGQTTLGRWQIQGNVTWSELKGNGTGEGKSNPALPYNIQGYTASPITHQTLFDYNLTSPYGRLATLGSPSPLAIHGLLGYTQDNSFGKLTYGVAYRFSSGAHYDNARSFSLGAVPGLTPDVDPNVSLGASEYLNGQRGTGVFNGSSYTDLSLQQDFTPLQVFTYKLTAFVKLTLNNAWNHQQQVSWNTTFDPNESGVFGTAGAPWTGANYGTANKASYFGEARSVLLSAGFKF